MISAYFGGCWATNIGNAFIDFGALHLTKKHNPTFYSEWSQMYFAKKGKYLNTFEHLKPKCAFFSGMVTCSQFIKDQADTIAILDKIGIPIILNGVGGEEYTGEEVSEFRHFLSNHNIAGLISRDEDTYEAYKDVVPMAFSGIDCGFFLPDCDQFKCIIDCEKRYTVINEDNNGFLNDPSSYAEYKQAVDWGTLCYSHHCLTELSESQISKNNTMLAELPYEYVNLYAMSEVTIATRIHACVATLAFGGKAMLLYDTPRVRVLHRVGCDKITEEPVTVDQQHLKKLKLSHISSLSAIMKSVK